LARELEVDAHGTLVAEIIPPQQLTKEV